jgi:hypothetical protein
VSKKKELIKGFGGNKILIQDFALPSLRFAGITGGDVPPPLGIAMRATANAFYSKAVKMRF